MLEEFHTQPIFATVYSKQEKAKLQQEFWTAFGKYIAPAPSAEGLKINWINYKTGVKDVRFFMEADMHKAVIGIKLSHEDPEIRALFFEQFEKLSPQLTTYLKETWQWHLHYENEHYQESSRIYTTLEPSNIFNKDHWPEIISFLKPKLIALDAFWCDWKYAFEDLSS